MDQTQQQQHIRDVFDQISRTMLSKGNDYSTEDRLKIFKEIGTKTNMHPVKVILVQASIKIERMCNLLDQGKDPENEAVTDTSLDLIAYAILADAMLKNPK